MGVSPDPEKHKRQLANLRSDVGFGKSHSPIPRKKGILYPTEWLKILGRMDEIELQGVYADREAPMFKRIAARVVLDGLHKDPTIAHRAIALICDRTTGKPAQTLNLIQNSRKDGRAIINEIKHRYQRSLSNDGSGERVSLKHANIVEATLVRKDGKE